MSFMNMTAAATISVRRPLNWRCSEPSPFSRHICEIQAERHLMTFILEFWLLPKWTGLCRIPLISRKHRPTMTESTPQTLSPAYRERVYRRNFALFLTDGILFMVAMGILSSTTVIPDFIRHLTHSEILIG